MFDETFYSEVDLLLSKKPAKSSGGNPYKVLYWMGAGVVVLLLGVLALAVLNKPEPYVVPDPERTVLWLYDDKDKAGPAQVAIIEESRSSSSLHAVPLPAPEDARKTYGERGSARAVDTLAASLQRRLHHRVFLPYSVVTKLIDAAGGIRVEGKDYTGASAVAYIREGGDQGARRAALVMLGLADAAATRGVSMGVSDGLALARSVDTDLDLTSIPDVLGRWSGYVNPRVETPVNFAPAELQKLLQPDPAEPVAK